MSNFSGDIIIDSNGNSILNALGDLQLSTNDDDFLQKIFTSAQGSWTYYNTFGFDFSPYFGRYINDDNRLINEIRSDLIEYLSSHFHLMCTIDMYSIEPGVIHILLNILQNNFSNKTIDIDLDLIEKKVHVNFENKNISTKEQKVILNKYQKRAVK